MDSSLFHNDCSCRTRNASAPTSSSTSYKPQNKYLCYLIDEFEKCSQQSTVLTKLQKEHMALQKELAEAQREVRDMKFEKQLLSEKVNTLQREMQEQKLLHSQLRDEASSEFRCLYRKAGNREKDIDLLKYQMKMSSKKYALDLENLRWELSTTRKYGSSSTDLGDDVKN